MAIMSRSEASFIYKKAVTARLEKKREAVMEKIFKEILEAASMYWEYVRIPNFDYDSVIVENLKRLGYGVFYEDSSSTLQIMGWAEDAEAESHRHRNVMAKFQECADVFDGYGECGGG